MAKKSIGRWERDPVHGGAIYFATYCGECKEKVYLSAFQAQEFVDAVSWSLNRQSLWTIIKKRIFARLPKIRIVIETPENSGGLGIKSEAQFRQHVMDLEHEKYKY